MNPVKRIDLSRRVFLAAWGLLTLILIFTVIFLVAALSENGQTPMSPTSAAGPNPATPREPSTTPANAAPTKEIVLYFPNLESRRLESQTASVEFSEFTVENCRKALEALAQGPGSKLNPTLPPSTKVLGVYMLDGGEVVVDFSMEFMTGFQKVRSATLETLVLAGIVKTLTQPALKGAKQPAASSVRILVHGSAPAEAFPAHVDVSAPLTPDSLRFASAES